MARQEGSLRKEKFIADDRTGETDAPAAAQRLQYEKGVPFGSKYAGKDLAVTSSDGWRVKLAGNADPIVGRLESIEADGWCSVVVGSDRMYFAKGDDANVVAGLGIVGDVKGGAYGYVRSPYQTVGDANNTPAGLTDLFQENARARGVIINTDIVDNDEYDVMADPNVIQVML
jgi:hypothetical protein